MSAMLAVMQTKLVRVGASYGIAIGEKLLAKLGFEPDMQLEVTIEDGCLVVARMGATRLRSPPMPGLPRPRPVDPVEPDEPRLGFPKKQPW